MCRKSCGALNASTLRYPAGTCSAIGTNIHAVRSISPRGIAVNGLEKGIIGERVVADFNHIGRVEGWSRESLIAALRSHCRLAHRSPETYLEVDASCPADAISF
jgi:hypothetical protein